MLSVPIDREEQREREGKREGQVEGKRGGSVCHSTAGHPAVRQPPQALAFLHQFLQPSLMNQSDKAMLSIFCPPRLTPMSHSIHDDRHHILLFPPLRSHWFIHYETGVVLTSVARMQRK